MKRLRALSLVLVALMILCLNCASQSSDLDKANEEAHEVKIAIEACLADAGVEQLDAAAVAWEGSSGRVTATSSSDFVYDAASYMSGKSFKATYDISQNGLITGAHNISWKGVVFDATYPQISHWSTAP